MQFLVTDGIDAWVQRGGRGGRQGGLCRSTILVQPSVVKKADKASARTAHEDGDTGDQEMEEGEESDDAREADDILLEFVTTKDCEWKLLDKYYENPEHEGKKLLKLY